jgi:predicted NBD/HSP70 family sugar kinase
LSVQVKRTVRDVRRHNRSVLLSYLYLHDPRSRLELAQDTGLSPGTVSTVIAEMMEEELVVEIGQVESDGGRPRTLLRVNPDYGHVIGIDVGETGVRAELFDLGMRPLASVSEPLPSDRPDPDDVVAQILHSLTVLTGQSGVDLTTVLGIGIGVFGTVQQGGSAVVHAQTVGWRAVRLEAMLRAEIAVPLYVDNGAKTLGQAEMWFGAGRGARHAVVTLIGSGVGAAVITDGSVYRGASSSAGEWGHTTLIYNGRDCRCGSKGCLEAYVGAEAILDRYRLARGGRPAPGENEESALYRLIQARPDSRPADRVLTETAGYLGAGIANLVNLFNPERIVLAGWAGHLLGGSLLPEIHSAAAARALLHPFSQTTIALGQLGHDAVALGAATLPMAGLLANGGGRPAMTAAPR